MLRPDIEPIRLNQLPKLVEELFGPTYRSQHLGLPGQWGGESRTELNLGEDVKLKEFVSVLRFRTPDCDLGPWENWSSDNPVVAYRLNYVGHPSLTTLWALGDSMQRQDLTATRNAVTEKAMTLIEGVAGMERRPPIPPEERGFLYASFQRGAAEDQTPRLETTVVIPRQFRKLDGAVVESPVLLQPGAVTEIFSRIETRRLMGKVGALGLTAGTSMPENLFSKPTLSDFASGAKVEDKGPGDSKLVAEELFEAWRHQAQSKGFGSNERDQILENAKRLGNLVRSHLNGRTIDDALAALYKRRADHVRSVEVS